MMERKARAVVAAYRKEPSCDSSDEITAKVLQRLEEDRDQNNFVTISGDKVTAALNNRKFKTAHPSILIFYLIQAVDLALNQSDVSASAYVTAADFRKGAAMANELAQFCIERRIFVTVNSSSVEQWNCLPELGRYLTEQAEFYEKSDANLQISQKKQGGSAAELLALRHFSKKLRDEMRIDPLPHDAVKWLVEAAMDYKITDSLAALGLRTLTPPAKTTTKKLKQHHLRIFKQNTSQKSANLDKSLKLRGRSYK